MNYEATIVVFDEIAMRKETCSFLIERNEEALKHLVGNERLGTLAELDILRQEYKWITQFQMKIMRELYNGSK
jgi:hypothetical protein